MPFTDVLDQSLMKYLFSDTSYTPPATWYVGLSTTTPSQVKGSTASHYWTFTEVSGGSYARVALTNNGTDWVVVTSEPTDGYTMANGIAATFPAPTGSWGTVTYFGLWSASTGGTLLAFGALTTSKAIGSGDTAPSFAIKALTVTNN